MTVMDRLSGHATFHHLGLAVRGFDEARRFYESIGYQCAEPVLDTIQQVECLMCTAPTAPAIELLRPLHEHSPISQMLIRYDAMLYHTCLEVTSVRDVVRVLKTSHRLVCVKQAAPAVLFDGRKVSFYYIKNVGLFEFLESSVDYEAPGASFHGV